MVIGQDLVLAAKKDLESFFTPAANFELKVELNSTFSFLSRRILAFISTFNA